MFTRPQFDCATLFVVVFFHYFITYFFVNMYCFWYWRHVLVNFIFQSPNKFFSNNRLFFSSLSVEYISISFFSSYDFINPLKKCCLCLSIFRLLSVLIHLIFLKKHLVIVTTFSSVKRTTHAYLLKLSIAHFKWWAYF